MRSASADVPTGVARRVRRLIGAFTARFACCQPRMMNIRLMARAVDNDLHPAARSSRSTVSPPGGPAPRAMSLAPDLTWTNDTGAAILVRSSSTPTTVTASLYGDNRGRRVRAESGPRQPLAGRNLAVTVTRRIRYADGGVERQPYTTSYDRPPSAE
ncbi:MAG: hypothetical protein WKF42_03420 [Solirubrobacteraceae bacterium]